MGDGKDTAVRLRRLARSVVPAAAVVAVFVAVWPWAEHPFSTPKLGVVWVAALASLALLPWSREPVAGTRRLLFFWALALLATTALSALVGEVSAFGPSVQAVGAALLLATWVLSGVNQRAVALAVAAAGAVVAVVTLLQAAGIDLFAAFAPGAEGTRLKLYGTLGNPDFVASVLGVSVCLTASRITGPRVPNPFTPSVAKRSRGAGTLDSGPALDSARAERNFAQGTS